MWITSCFIQKKEVKMKLSDIKGLKEKRIAELEKAGIMTPMDLISCFPAKYVNLTDFTDF